MNLHGTSEFEVNINVALGLVQTDPPQQRRIDGEDEMEMRVHIGEMAEKSGLSSRTLRHYEEIGLIPATGRTEGGFRVYTDEDFRRLMTIRRMKALNYSTAEMGELLTLLDVLESDAPDTERSKAREKLLALLEDANAKREKLARQVERADEFLGILRARLV
ncbi:MerR family DNA-binding transcriptional regulator [Brevibacterium luteolum]|uniref:MerR family DNA-binding transcriptional regulator n=1 Tax=Brevibacterium luteolum TaxID=199591 RepID=UPI002154FBD0|nr:MerR family DNA-binding transcriptional regulator [Brevibacterium luteolum]